MLKIKKTLNNLSILLKLVDNPEFFETVTSELSLRKTASNREASASLGVGNIIAHRHYLVQVLN